MENNCPIHTKNHRLHDERIQELEAFRKSINRTSRALGDRIVRLEMALLKLDRMYQSTKNKLDEANALLKKWM